MPENLSPISQEAARLRSEYIDNASFRQGFQTAQNDFIETADIQKGASKESPEFWQKQLQEGSQHAKEMGDFMDEKAKEYEMKENATLWQAHKHKEQYLGEYIETARQEAEAQGVHIKLEQPKE